MQKHKCKLCSKSFCNGRALGGHMKSHLVASQLATRKRLSESPSSIYSSSSSSVGEIDGKSLGYGLRENPRKSFRVLNPDPDSSNLFLIDDNEIETETEPESENPVKKRTRAQVLKKKKKQKPSHNSTESRKSQKQRTSRNSPESRKSQKQKTSRNSTESLEPASSVSDGSPEQDLALCLMMLSRDSRVPIFKEIQKSPEKRHLPELRRCVIDLNLPPPQESEISTVLSAV